MKKATNIPLKELEIVTGGTGQKSDLETIRKTILNRKTLKKIKKIVT